MKNEQNLSTVLSPEAEPVLEGDKEKAPTVNKTAEADERININDLNSDTIIPQNNGNVKHLSQESENKFYCNIDTKAYKDKETAKRETSGDRGIVKRLKSKNRITKMTAERLAKAVTMGYCFTTAALNGTTAAHFVSQQLAILDIDNDADRKKAETISGGKVETLEEAYVILEAHGIEKTPPTTIEDAEKVLAEHGIEYSFMYYSFSHSTSPPKFRIVCVLDKPIIDPAEAKRLNQYLISLFAQADKICHNLDRFYYPASPSYGLATEVHDRTTTIEIPADFMSLESERADDSPPLPEPPEPDADTTAALMGDRDNELTPKSKGKKDTPAGQLKLGQAYRDFDLLGYIEQTTGIKPERKGRNFVFNPCPLCGFHDHFQIDVEKTHLYHSKSDKDIGKGVKDGGESGGNIFNYLKAKNPEFSDIQARDYFKYDILGLDREAEKKAYKEGKKAKKTQDDSQNGADEEQYEEITIAGVEKHLKEIGVTVKYNKITRKVDIRGLDAKHSREHMTDSLPILAYNTLKQLYTNCAKGDIQDFLNVISTDNSYNPVTEMLEGGKWDGVDRLPELYRIMRIDETDKLSRRLIYKWLWQGLSIVRNELEGAYGADGLLVLQGAQGIGKTTLVRKLAVKQEFCLIGKSLNFQDKDTLRRCGSAWLVELGEIETTFKSDKEKLKAFITDEIDMYRLPYGRTDVELPRRTSLIGTCNSTEYLIDETGNRRFWTIPLTAIDLDALEKFDALQLWLQIDSQTKDNRQGFRLTIEEQAALNKRNGTHEKPLKSEIEVRDIISKRSNNPRYFEKEVTITDFKMSDKALEKFDAREIGKVLDKMGIESKRKKLKNGDVIRIRKLLMLGEDFEHGI